MNIIDFKENCSSYIGMQGYSWILIYSLQAKFFMNRSNIKWYEIKQYYYERKNETN